MKALNILTIAFAISLAGPLAAYAVEESTAPVVHHHHHAHHHQNATVHNAPPARTIVPAAPVVAAPFGPRPPAVENDSDGLSRDNEECNMGCLDTTE